MEMDYYDCVFLHDVIYDSVGENIKEIDIIIDIFNKLPENIKSIAVEFGCNDTVFRDMMFEELYENKIKYF